MASSMGIAIPTPSGIKLPSARVTIVLVVLNVIVYVITALEGRLLEISRRWLSWGAYIPILLIHPSQWYRVLTSMFLHANLFHIFFNMLYLYNFGRPVEAVIGSKRFLILYFLSGLLATLFHTAFISVEGPLAAVTPAVGASGAISGILGAYLLLFPGSRISMYFFYFYFPVAFTWRASAYLIFWFVMQVLQGYMGGSIGVAVFAHVGGFIGGLAFLPYVMDKKRHHLIRMLTATRRYLYYVYFGHRGIGSTSKLVLMLAILLVMAGGAYSAVTAQGTTSQMRVLNFKVNYKLYCDGNVPCGGGYSEEAVIVRATDGRAVLLAPIAHGGVRVVFNRLSALGLLYTIGGGGRTFINGTYIVRIFGYRLRVILRMEAEYDQEGFLASAEGSMATDVLTCIGFHCEPSGVGEYNFVIQTMYGTKEQQSFESAIPILALATLLTSTLALGTVLRKADELAIII